MKKNIISPSILKGTRDYSHVETALRREIIEILESVFMQFGYKAIETPVLTPADIFTDRYGDNDRLMYTFTDKGERNVSLPYDLTVPFARYIASQRHHLTFPFKRFQTAKVWRAEKPQRGRLREFVQTDIDIIGSTSLLCEAEIVKVIHDALLALGLIDIRFRFNSRRLQNSIFQSLNIAEADVKSVLKIFNQLKTKNDCLSALLKSGITNSEHVYEILKSEPSSQLSVEKLKHTVANSSITHEIEHFLLLTSELGLNTHLFHFEPTLSRGLDYYTGIVFEIDFNNITSICSGGRYDDLCGKFCNNNFSGVGASFGLDRLTEALLNNQSDLVSKKGMPPSDVLVARFDNHADEALAQLRIFRSLVDANIRTEIYFDNHPLNKQFQFAQKSNFNFVVMCGKHELDESKVKIKRMDSGKQKILFESQLVSYIKGFTAHF